VPVSRQKKLENNLMMDNNISFERPSATAGQKTRPGKASIETGKFDFGES
jgi:hypothetical protein